MVLILNMMTIPIDLIYSEEDTMLEIEIRLEEEQDYQEVEMLARAALY